MHFLLRSKFSKSSVAHALLTLSRIFPDLIKQSSQQGPIIESADSILIATVAFKSSSGYYKK